MPGDRQRRLLKAIIDIYVKTAEPVGSKALAEHLGGSLSPATIRNEMAELLAMGFLEQPHTSAGRVPTHRAYRLYVNELMNAYMLTSQEESEMSAALRVQMAEYDRMMKEVSRALSELTRYTALTVTPRGAGGMEIRRVDIVPCDGAAYVFVLILGSAGIVKNTMYRAALPVREESAAALAEIFNRELEGVEPGAVTALQIKAIERAAPEDGDELLAAMLEFIKSAARETEGHDLHLRGESNLLSHPEYRDLDKAREMIDFLTGAHTIDWLPGVAGAAPGVGQLQFRIGSENLPAPLKDASVIVASCALSGGSRAYIGIVGPTRMDYARLAARMSFFARGLSAILNDGDENGKDDIKNAEGQGTGKRKGR